MPRPPVEVADVMRTAGESFFECSQRWFTWLHLKVWNAILRCRYRRARRTRGCVFPMRTTGYLIQLMQKPALPKMSS